MNAENRFLRKAWTIILNHFIENFTEYEPLLGPSYQKNLEKKKAYSYFEGNYSFEDQEEQNWFDQGIRFQGQDVKIRYERIPCLEDQIGNICLAIAKKGKLHTDKAKTTIVVDPAAEKRALIRPSQDLNCTLSAYTFAVSNQIDKNPVRIFSAANLTTYPFAKKVIDFAIKLLAEDPTGKEELLAMRAIEAEFEKKYNKQPEVDESDLFFQNIQDDQNELWDPGARLTKFRNTRWLCFQRTDGRRNSDANYGISISPVEIRFKEKGKNGMYGIYMLCSYYPENTTKMETHEYTGMMTEDPSTKSIILELKRQKKHHSPASVAYIILHTTDDPNECLLLGYHLYFSLYSNKFVAKTIVFQKFENSKIDFKLSAEQKLLPPKALFPLINGDFNPKDGGDIFPGIPLNIRRFLAKRHQNRLTLPSQRISQLSSGESSLHKWIRSKYDHADHAILKACCGDYNIYYYYGEDITDTTTADDILKCIRMDRLSISFDENLAEFQAVFIHERKNKSTFTGKASIKMQTLEVFVEENGKAKYNTTDLNMVFLSFSLPGHDESVFDEEYKKYHKFEGLISGLNDQKNTPVAFITLIQKIDPRDNEPRSDLKRRKTKDPFSKALVKFFRSNRHQLKIKLKPFETDNNIHVDKSAQTLAKKGYKFGIGENETWEVFDPETGRVVHRSESSIDFSEFINTFKPVIQGLPYLKTAVTKNGKD